MSLGYIVDGYNLMHCVPDLGRMASQDLEGARETLVARLAAFRGRKRIRVAVVFDGSDAAGFSRSQNRRVEVIFSAPPQNADERIVKMVRALKHPKGWTVVSSDRWVKEQVEALGARTVESGPFAQLLPGAKGRGTGTLPEKPEMRPSDVAEWEAFFRRKGK